MGHTQSTAKNDGFTGVLPGGKRTKRAIKAFDTRAEAPAVSRPVEAAIPVIPTPPHALIRGRYDGDLTTGPLPLETSRPETPRRDGDDPNPGFAVSESVRRSHTLQQFEQTCSEILAGFLYVSNLQVAQDQGKLRTLGITHIINCCKEVVCFQPLACGSTAYLQLALRDGVQEDLVPFLPQVIQFIEHSREPNERALSKSKVLIHCHQGVSRSCALAIAYVMYATRCGFQDANAWVKAQRAICSPNAAFICQLIEWERELAAAAASGIASYGLYRLAPHAAYDASTLVLKPCYHTNSRRKVSVNTSDGTTVKWLWSQGLFVYMDHLGQLVIWKGAHCGLHDGVAQAKAHVETMLQVYARETARAELPIVVLEQQLSDTFAGVDAFGYAEELAWLAATVAAPATGPVSSCGDAAACTDEISTKPLLFVLEDASEHSWELITDYSCGDLHADSVLLLVAPAESFLWIGSRVKSMSVEELQQLATPKSFRHTNSLALLVEHQTNESDAFWEAFEAGY